MARYAIPTDANVIMEYLTEHAAAAGQVTEEMIKDWIAQQAKLPPESTCISEGAVTDEQKAYLACKIAEGEVNGTPNEVVPSGNNATGGTGRRSTRKPKARPTSSLTIDQESALAAYVTQSMEAKANVSNNSKIPEFFVSRPTSNEYIDEGTKGSIIAESWKTLQDKITSGEYEVLPDFEDRYGNDVLSKTNYDVLSNAAASKSDVVPVMRNDKVGASIGYNVMVAASPNEHPEARPFPKGDLQHFVEMKAAGYIVAGMDTLGVQLKQITVKSNDSQTPDSKRVVLSDMNKKAAVKASHYKSVRKVTGQYEDKTQKSALAFYVKKKVVTTDAQGHKVVGTEWQKDSQGNIRKFAIRPSIKCRVHTLEMIKEYDGLFPVGKIDPTKPKTGEELAKMAESTVQDLAVLLSDRNAPLKVNQELQETLKELTAVINNGAANPDNVTV